jgi:hypothetical protein
MQQLDFAAWNSATVEQAVSFAFVEEGTGEVRAGNRVTEAAHVNTLMLLVAAASSVSRCSSNSYRETFPAHLEQPPAR